MPSDLLLLGEDHVLAAALAHLADVSAGEGERARAPVVAEDHLEPRALEVRHVLHQDHVGLAQE
eukprot:8434876-Alexandrium_andersonii.AAC.1